MRCCEQCSGSRSLHCPHGRARHACKRCRGSSIFGFRRQRGFLEDLEVVQLEVKRLVPNSRFIRALPQVQDQRNQILARPFGHRNKPASGHRGSVPFRQGTAPPHLRQPKADVVTLQSPRNRPLTSITPPEWSGRRESRLSGWGQNEPTPR
eukprot:TRINITY_DN6186_c0_g1_i2.p1 TRINITY_DN6186_c0_g1~~TRINITY_DN6186_c0_g1_i2.p1  ORF type:complete len:151 (-),score=1.54 TRINITY_DN6186_c0_g1_i2:408-860(-)